MGVLGGGGGFRGGVVAAMNKYLADVDSFPAATQCSLHCFTGPDDRNSTDVRLQRTNNLLSDVCYTWCFLLDYTSVKTTLRPLGSFTGLG